MLLFTSVNRTTLVRQGNTPQQLSSNFFLPRFHHGRAWRGGHVGRKRAGIPIPPRHLSRRMAGTTHLWTLGVFEFSPESFRVWAGNAIARSWIMIVVGSGICKVKTLVRSGDTIIPGRLESCFVAHEHLFMTHLLRAFTYLGLRGSRRNSVAPVLPQRWIQLADTWTNLWHWDHCTTHHKGDFRYRLFISANRRACCRMGQASALVKGYGVADENAGEKSRKRVYEGLKGFSTNEGSGGKDDSAKVSNVVDGSVGNGVEQIAAADVLANVVEAEAVFEAAESPEHLLTNELDKKIEKELVSESKEVSKPGETEKVVIEEPVNSQTALNLALDELGDPPERPLPGDCCGQGCDVCVWDTYNDELRDYLARKQTLLKKSK